MSEIYESKSWRDEFASLVSDTGIRYAGIGNGDPAAGLRSESYGFGGGGGESESLNHVSDTRMQYAGAGNGEPAAELRSESYGFGGDSVSSGGGESESLKDQATEFAKAAAEMMIELGRGCRDIVKQSFVKEDSFIVRKFGGPCSKVCGKLRFLNEFLPEDRDPAHVWPIIFIAFIFVVAALTVNTEHNTPVPLVKKVSVHPPNATRIMLPDGRQMAYLDQGVPADRARFSIIAPHSFLSSRLAGIPGVKTLLLEEFGVRLITYDLPGFGESDPHPNRNLESSAQDMCSLANAVDVKDKFWVMGFSGGGMHAWAAVRYIPDRLAGAAMFAPVVNPYEPRMTKEERDGTWGRWTSRRKLMYFLARRFPSLLSSFYRRSFLSGNHGQIDRRLSLSLGKKDRGLIEDPIFEDLWQRDVEESIRQGNTKPFVEEAVLLVSHWGFTLSDLKMQNKPGRKGILNWLRSMYSQVEQEWTGFLGPIHIWQGMDDGVVPPSITDFVHRVLPGATVHKLANEGHFSYLYFCDICHRQIFTTLFGAPQGPLDNTSNVDQAPSDTDTDIDTENTSDEVPPR